MVLIRRVEGTSMVPRYKPGAIVVAWRFMRPRVGRVAIVQHNQRELLKRITAIKHNKIFIEGDNPKSSTDSRHWGWLPISSVRAVVRGGK
jgi:phage repressor protein C with HTH and peptisase S24 domain